MLLDLSTPEAINELSADSLAQLLAQDSKNRLGFVKAEQLKQAAQSSFGVKFAQEAFTFQLRSMIEQVKVLEQQVKATEDEIAQIMNKLDSVIETIPGIGKVNGAAILGEIGDINKFDKPEQLVAYAGIDASVTQSGQYEATHNVMSKRGPPYLRKALFSSALIIYRYDPVYGAFYAKKKAEGKHHLTIMGAIARKICYVIFAMLKKNEPYQIRL